ncbi:MAG: hypothetical protein ACK56I_14135, partial [bacterium]
LQRGLSRKGLGQAARRAEAAVPRIDRDDERSAHLGRRLDGVAERAPECTFRTRRYRSLIGLVRDGLAIEPARRGLEHRQVFPRGFLDPAHVHDVALELQPLLLLGRDAARLLDAAIGLRA